MSFGYLQQQWHLIPNLVHCQLAIRATSKQSFLYPWNINVLVKMTKILCCLPQMWQTAEMRHCFEGVLFLAQHFEVWGLIPCKGHDMIMQDGTSWMKVLPKDINIYVHILQRLLLHKTMLFKTKTNAPLACEWKRFHWRPSYW